MELSASREQGPRKVVLNELRMPTVTLRDVLKSLQSKRASLHSEITKLDEMITQLEGLDDTVLEVSVDVGTGIFGMSATDMEGESSARVEIPATATPEEVALLSAEVIEAAAKPLTRGEIVARLRERGVSLAGKNVNKNLGTILWRNRHRFVQIDKLGYWLADKPLDGIYEPGDVTDPIEND